MELSTSGWIKKKTDFLFAYANAIGCKLHVGIEWKRQQKSWIGLKWSKIRIWKIAQQSARPVSCLWILDQFMNSILAKNPVDSKDSCLYSCLYLVPKYFQRDDINYKSHCLSVRKHVRPKLFIKVYFLCFWVVNLRYDV